MRTCAKCKKAKDGNEFYSDMHNRCILCLREYQREYSRINREKCCEIARNYRKTEQYKKKRDEYVKKNKEKIKEKQRELYLRRKQSC